MYVACTYVYMCIHVCACISILTCLNIIRVCICIHVCAYTCVCAQVHMCMLMEIRDQTQGLFPRSHPLIFETRSHQPLAGWLGYISRPAKPRDPPVSELVLPFQTCTTKPIVYVCAGIWTQVFMLAWLTDTPPPPPPLTRNLFQSCEFRPSFLGDPNSPHHSSISFRAGYPFQFCPTLRAVWPAPGCGLCHDSKLMLISEEKLYFTSGCFAYMYVCVPCSCLVSTVDTGSPKTGITDGREQPCGAGNWTLSQCF